MKTCAKVMYRMLVSCFPHVFDELHLWNLFYVVSFMQVAVV